MNTTIGRLYWHVHHDRLCEYLTAPVEERIEYIQQNKPAEEVETRLRLLQPVRGVLPAACDQAWQARAKARQACAKAWQACDQTWQACPKAWQVCDQTWQAYVQARQAYDQTRQAYDQARQAYVQALRDNMPAILALHAQECPDCPWDAAQQTIFPTKGGAR